MISLEEHNRRCMERSEEVPKVRPNGIACPKCEKELVDSAPMFTLTSSPPQKAVACPSCGFTGYRRL